MYIKYHTVLRVRVNPTHPTFCCHCFGRGDNIGFIGAGSIDSALKDIINVLRFFGITRWDEIPSYKHVDCNQCVGTGRTSLIIGELDVSPYTS